MHHTKLDQAEPGDNIGFNVRGLGIKDVGKGNICGDAKVDSPKPCKSFVAQVIILGHPGNIKSGY